MGCEVVSRLQNDPAGQEVVRCAPRGVAELPCGALMFSPAQMRRRVDGA